MKFFVLLLVIIFSAVNISAQEKWSSTRKPVTGDYLKLPSENYSWQNTNKTTKVYTYENDAEKGVVFIGVLQNKRASLQQQDGSWINNQAYHQLRIITKHVIKE